jgi:hypothetical protein
MASLASISKTYPKTSTFVPKYVVLTGSANYAIHIKTRNEYLDTNHGRIGQDIIKGVATKPETLGPRPAYNDVKLHPFTGLPQVPNVRKYEQVALTTDQINLGLEFDRNELLLTAASQSRLDADQALYDKLHVPVKANNKETKADDDNCLTILREHIGSTVMPQLIISKGYLEFSKLGADAVHRSMAFCAAYATTFSAGNSTETVDQIIKLFNIRQDPLVSNPATFFEAHQNQMEAVIPLIEDKTHPGYISIAKFTSVLLPSGIDRLNRANQEGIKKHITKNGDTALELPGELVTEVMESHTSELNQDTQADKPSQQSSAFYSKQVNTKPLPPKDKKQRDFTQPIPGKTDHCTNCFDHLHLYFYHPLHLCKRSIATAADKQEALAKFKANKPSAKQPYLKANANVLTPAVVAPGLTRGQCHLNLNNLPGADPSIKNSTCFAFLSANHPDDLDDYQGLSSNMCTTVPGTMPYLTRDLCHAAISELPEANPLITRSIAYAYLAANYPDDLD